MYVELTEREEKQHAAMRQALLENPPRPALLGACKGCGRGIPVGYLPVVTGWRKENRAGMTFSVPEEMWCRGCAVHVEGRAVHIRRHRHTAPAPAPEEEEQQPTIKETAQRLYAAIEPRVRYSSKRVAERAKVPYSELVERILKRLAEKGKLQNIDGKWRRA